MKIHLQADISETAPFPQPPHVPLSLDDDCVQATGSETNRNARMFTISEMITMQEVSF